METAGHYSGCTELEVDSRVPLIPMLTPCQETPLQALSSVSMQVLLTGVSEDGGPAGVQKGCYMGPGMALCPLPAFQIFGNHHGKRDSGVCIQEDTLSVRLELPALGPCRNDIHHVATPSLLHNPHNPHCRQGN